MMGGKSVTRDQMDWSPQNTETFITIMYDRVKKKQLQTLTFKGDIWEKINTELTQIIREDYGVERLKGKYNQLW